MYTQANKINEILSNLFLEEGIILVDFKVEFGINTNGEILLADEISPDTCRLWDSVTLEKLDKDRFRRDLGSIEEAYIEILKRIQNSLMKQAQGVNTRVLCRKVRKLMRIDKIECL